MDQNTIKALEKPFAQDKIKSKPGQGGRRMSYISHGLITERLNEVDPNWSWRSVKEHIYTDQNGRLHCEGVTVEMTVCGVTRVEAGGPQRQDGFANELKNAYSDALKRAAMRFGVALAMWESLVDAEGDEDYAAPQAPQQAQRPQPALQPNERLDTTTGEITRPVASLGQPATEKQIKFLHALAKEKGFSHDDLHEMSTIRYGKSVGDLDRRDASAFVDALQALRPRDEQAQAPTPIRQDVAPSAPVTDDTAWTTLWTELRAAGVPSGNIPAATDLIGTWNSTDPAALLATLRMKTASMPRQQGSAGNDRYSN